MLLPSDDVVRHFGFLGDCGWFCVYVGCCSFTLSYQLQPFEQILRRPPSSSLSALALVFVFFVDVDSPLGSFSHFHFHFPHSKKRVKEGNFSTLFRPFFSSPYSVFYTQTSINDDDEEFPHFHTQNAEKGEMSWDGGEIFSLSIFLKIPRRRNSIQILNVTQNYPLRSSSAGFIIFQNNFQFFDIFLHKKYFLIHFEWFLWWNENPSRSVKLLRKIHLSIFLIFLHYF